MSFIGAMVATTVGGTDTNTTTTGPAYLTGDERVWALAVIVVFTLVAGGVVIWGRRALAGTSATSLLPRRSPKTADAQAASPRTTAPADDSDGTLVRSWIAISLVGGLLILTVCSFWIENQTLQSALVGGVIANAGVVIAFYFATKSSDQARRDFLNASPLMTVVPNLLGVDLVRAQALLATTPLRLDPDPVQPPDGSQVVAQHPSANQSAGAGTAVRASFAGPVPDLTGRTLAEATEALRSVGLKLVGPSPDPAVGQRVTRQSPVAGDPVPIDRSVRADFG